MNLPGQQEAYHPGSYQLDYVSPIPALVPEPSSMVLHGVAVLIVLSYARTHPKA